MAGRLGAAASKSSLAAAARGQVLPTWETAWEFVRVLAVDRLGQDPAETERVWRARWEQARSASLIGPDTGAEAATTANPPIGAGHGAAGSGDLPGGGAPANGGAPGGGAPGAGADGRPQNLKRVAAVAAISAAMVAGTGAGVAIVLTAAQSGPKQTSEATGLVPEAVVPPATPATPASGDDSAFEGDLTYLDGSEVPAGETFLKKWRLRNTGTVRWENRFLTRVNTTLCKAPEMVRIPATDPGETVDIEVKVTAADRSTRCKIDWKMTDADKNPFFPGKRPIFLDVQVRGD